MNGRIQVVGGELVHTDVVLARRDPGRANHDKSEILASYGALTLPSEAYHLSTKVFRSPLGPHQ
jgi:hypothetical protein